tara:strand:+ start:170 stop:643 length:474 start_codon:yes stop_codon:yes gene_type:complete
MAYQKLQVSRALQVIPSDTINIPSVAHRSAQGTTVGTAVTNKLVDTGATFLDSGLVKKNDIVYNTTDSTIARVVDIESNSTLLLSADIFIAAEGYQIYKDNNDGCILYVGGLGNVEVVTVGGDEIVLPGISAGSFLPLQVTRVKANLTTATNIIALW